MRISIQCSCGKVLRTKREAVGKQVRCPNCGQRVVVTLPSDPFADEALANLDAIRSDSPKDDGPEALRFECYGCGQRLRVPRTLAGQRVKCAKCGRSIRVAALTDPGPSAEQDRDDATSASDEQSGHLIGKTTEGFESASLATDQQFGPTHRDRLSASKFWISPWSAIAVALLAVVVVETSLVLLQRAILPATESAKPTELIGLRMAYWFVTLPFAIWVAVDGHRRKIDPVGWTIGTALVGPLAFPVYAAKRPLKEGEVREGGTAWNVLRNFSLFWSLLIWLPGLLLYLVFAVLAPKGVVNTVGFFAIGGVWFFTVGGVWLAPLLGALVLGVFLKKASVCERGPTGPLAASDGDEAGRVQPDRRRKRLALALGSLTAVLLVLFLAEAKTREGIGERENERRLARVPAQRNRGIQPARERVQAEPHRLVAQPKGHPFGNPFPLRPIENSELGERSDELTEDGSPPKQEVAPAERKAAPVVVEWTSPARVGKVHLQTGVVMDANVLSKDNGHYLLALPSGPRLRVHEGWVIRVDRSGQQEHAAERNHAGRRAAERLVAELQASSTSPPVLPVIATAEQRQRRVGRNADHSIMEQFAEVAPADRARVVLDQGQTVYVAGLVVPLTKGLPTNATATLELRPSHPQGLAIQLLAAKSDPLSLSVAIHSGWNVPTGLQDAQINAIVYRDGRRWEQQTIHLQINVRRKPPGKIEASLYEIYQRAQLAQLKQEEAEQHLVTMRGKIEELEKLESILRHGKRGPIGGAAGGGVVKVPSILGGEFTFNAPAVRRRERSSVDPDVLREADSRYRKLLPEIQQELQLWSTVGNGALNARVAALTRLALARDTLEGENSELANGLLDLLADYAEPDERQK